MKRYVCCEHLETSLDDRDPSLGFAKYEATGRCIEDGALCDIEVLKIDSVSVFAPDGTEIKLEANRKLEVEKWLEEEALQYFCESRLVHWEEAS